MTRGIRRVFAMTSFALAAGGGALVAQPPRGSLPGDADGAPARRRMEQRLREGLWQVAKSRIGLTDEQMTRLEAATLKSDERRRALGMVDRAQRQLLRTELLQGDGADQARVAAALDRLLQVHRDRLDIVADEQRELAQFMTPVQRARYAGLQDELRHRAEELRRARRDGPPL